MNEAHAQHEQKRNEGSGVRMGTSVTDHEIGWYLVYPDNRVSDTIPDLDAFNQMLAYLVSIHRIRDDEALNFYATAAREYSEFAAAEAEFIMFDREARTLGQACPMCGSTSDQGTPGCVACELDRIYVQLEESQEAEETAMDILMLILPPVHQ